MMYLKLQSSLECLYLDSGIQIPDIFYVRGKRQSLFLSNVVSHIKSGKKPLLLVLQDPEISYNILFGMKSVKSCYNVLPIVKRSV